MAGSDKYPTMLRSGTSIPQAKNHHDPPALRYAQMVAALRAAPSHRRSLPGHAITGPAFELSAMVSVVMVGAHTQKGIELMRSR